MYKLVSSLLRGGVTQYAFVAVTLAVAGGLAANQFSNLQGLSILPNQIDGNVYGGDRTAAPILAITQEGPEKIRPNAEVTYKMTITNNYNTTLTDVRIVDASFVTNGMKLIPEKSSSNCTYGLGKFAIKCEFESINVGETKEVQLTGLAPNYSCARKQPIVSQASAQLRTFQTTDTATLKIPVMCDSSSSMSSARSSSSSYSMIYEDPCKWMGYCSSSSRVSSSSSSSYSMIYDDPCKWGTGFCSSSSSWTSSVPTRARVYSPNGGEVFTRGRAFDVKWQYTGKPMYIGVVDKRYEIDQKTILGWIIAGNQADGASNWDGTWLGNLNGEGITDVRELSQGPFKVIATENACVGSPTCNVDVSDGYFNISGLKINVDHPNTSTPMVQGKPNVIRWSKGYGQVDVGLVTESYNSNDPNSQGFLGWIAVNQPEAGSVTWDGNTLRDAYGNISQSVNEFSLVPGPYRILVVSDVRGPNTGCLGVMHEACNNDVSDKSFSITKTTSSSSSSSTSSTTVANTLGLRGPGAETFYRLKVGQKIILEASQISTSEPLLHGVKIDQLRCMPQHYISSAMPPAEIRYLGHWECTAIAETSDKTPSDLYYTLRGNPDNRSSRISIQVGESDYTLTGSNGQRTYSIQPGDVFVLTGNVPASQNPVLQVTNPEALECEQLNPLTPAHGTAVNDTVAPEEQYPRWVCRAKEGVASATAEVFYSIPGGSLRSNSVVVTVDSNKGNLYVIRDATPIRNHQLLGGTLGDEILRLQFHADLEDIDVTDIQFTSSGSLARSVDRLELYTEGAATPFALATVAGCGTDPKITKNPSDNGNVQTFCASMENLELVVPAQRDVDILVRPRMKTDEQGGLINEKISFFVGSGLGVANKTIQARGLFSSHELIMSNGDNSATGEIFIGRVAPSSLSTEIVGNKHISVHSKITSIINASPDPNGTSILVGPSRTIGKFRFTAAAHANLLNGLNTPTLRAIIFNVIATNMQIDHGSFRAYNEDDPSVKGTCRPFTPAGIPLPVGPVSGTFIIGCNLTTMNGSIPNGDSLTLGIEANVLQTQLNGNTSTLQVSLTNFNSIGYRTLAPNSGHVYWLDREGSKYRAGFFWIEYPSNSVTSTTYVSG